MNTPFLVRRDEVKHQRVPVVLDVGIDGFKVHRWAIGHEALAKGAHPKVILVKLLSPGQCPPGDQLMHIGICRLLEPFGFYEFDFFDADGWPHFKVKEELPSLKAGEQTLLMKEALVLYFLEKEYIE